MKFKEFLEDSLEDSLEESFAKRKIKEIQDQIKNLDKDSDTYDNDGDMLVAMPNVYQDVEVAHSNWKKEKFKQISLRNMVKQAVGN